MKIFVVVLHFGDVSVTKNCVTSLLKNDTFPKKILVINNTTRDIKKEFGKRILLLNSKKNLGFAKGVNKGITYALKQKASHILLLNNDTTIKKPIVKKLLHGMETCDAGIVGPAIMSKKQETVFYDIGGKINTLFWRTSHNEVPLLQKKQSKIVDYVSGCCMLIKKDVFKKIGLFDESFFLYYEDADFCLRAKETGITTAIVPSVVISHLLSASKGTISSFTIYHLMKSGVLFGRKYSLSFVQKIANRCFLLLQSFLFVKANHQSLTSVVRALLS